MIFKWNGHDQNITTMTENKNVVKCWDWRIKTSAMSYGSAAFDTNPDRTESS